jgi:hypothetical protein
MNSSEQTRFCFLISENRTICFGTLNTKTKGFGSLIKFLPSLAQIISIHFFPELNKPDIVRILIKLPNGQRLERRFSKMDSLKSLFYYVFCHPDSPDEFDITTNFPRKVVPCRFDFCFIYNYHTQRLGRRRYIDQHVLDSV